MFFAGQKAKVLYCPTNPEFNGQDCVILKHIPLHLNSNVDFSPSTFELESAFWSVTVNDEIVDAFIRHDIAIGDQIIIDNPPHGWKELKKRDMRVEQILRRQYLVRSPRGLTVAVEDVHPTKMEIPKNVTVGFSSEDIVNAAFEILECSDVEGTDFQEFFVKLGISVTDANISRPTKVKIGCMLNVEYPKGIDLGDKNAVYTALAKMLKSMTELELVEFLHSQHDFNIRVL